MRHLLTAGALAVLAGHSSLAVAADLGGYRPPPAPESFYEPVSVPGIWHGVYIGLNSGYGWGNGNSPTLSGPGVSGSFGSLEPDGFIGGGQIGFNVQSGALVFGAEADLQYSDLNDTAGGVVNGYVAGAATDINWFSTLRGRLGYSTGPALLYVTGGFAFADVDYAVAATNGINAVAMSSSGIETGYTVGGGLEWALGGNWTTKLEYLYVDLGEQTVSNGTFSSTTDTDFHTGRLGVNYRF